MPDVVDGALSPGFGMPLAAEEVPPSFFPDDDFPPFGMRLAILEDFLVESAEFSRSSFGGELSFEDFTDLFLSSLSLHGAKDLLPLAEVFDEDEEEVLLGAETDAAGVFVELCLAVALLLPLLHNDPVGVCPSSPYSERSSSSCSVISAMDGDALEADRGLMSLNFSNIDLCGGAAPNPTLEAS